MKLLQQMLLSALALPVVLAGPVHTAEIKKSVPEAEPRLRLEREAWVLKCLKDFQWIKPGMTRAEIQKAFPMDGGLQAFSPVRFTHPDCPYFKIDISFIFQRDTNDQNRAIFSPNDKATWISKPYIETPFCD